MKRLTHSLIAVSAICYSNFIFAANWIGFYLGANAGYWQSQANNVSTTGSVKYINPADVPGASNIANALAQLATNHSSFNAYGLIGGGQAGYNVELSRGLLFGLNVDLNGLTNLNNSITLRKTVNLVDFPETYAGTFSITQKINYLSAVRGRLGYLYSPDFLIYGTGGFAYGNVTLETAWAAQESLGSSVFPTITTQNNATSLLTGWVAGAGVEWLFKPNWSAMLEYTYYSLNNLNVPATLAQMNASVSPSVLWGSAATNTVLSLSLWDVRVGLNYHFL